MKKLRITVNGRVYEVVVQLLEDDEQHVPGANALPAPPAASPSPPQPRAPATAHNGGPSAGGSTGSPNGRARSPDEITAPIAGTIQKFLVREGEEISARAPVVLLDAMKMDTTVNAPRAGTVARICAEPGATVRVGELLVCYVPEV